jgi:hypothetical protein
MAQRRGAWVDASGFRSLQWTTTTFVRSEKLSRFQQKMVEDTKKPVEASKPAPAPAAVPKLSLLEEDDEFEEFPIEGMQHILIDVC